MVTRGSRKLGVETLESRQLLTAWPELLLDVNPGPDSARIEEFYEFNGEVYFRATTEAHGAELWKTDGTQAGTVMVKDIAPGKASSTPGWFTEFRGELYFSAADVRFGDELWKTDGTSAGTVRVADIHPGDADAFPDGLTLFQNDLYFAALDERGFELWKSDGTASGTVLVADINPGEGDADPGSFSGFHEFRGELYFNADDGGSGMELWKTDGTTAGTVRVADLDSEDGSWPGDFREHQGDLFFSAERRDEFGDYRSYLWKVDGLTGLVESAASVPLNPRVGFVPYQGELYFSGRGETTGFEPYKTNGTDDGTELVADLVPGPSDSRPGGFVAFGGRLYFTAIDDEIGRHTLFRFDGGPLPPFRLHDGEVPQELAMAEFRGELYFQADAAAAGLELFKTDGSFAEQPELVRDVSPGESSSSPRPLTVFDDRLYFLAETPAAGVEIWRTDGTDEGTELVQDIFVGGGDFTEEPALFRFFPFEQSLLFIAGAQSTGQELWVMRREPTRLPGDADGNGQVQFVDFLILSSNFGKLDATWEDGDFDGDGQVQFADFLILSAQFGAAATKSK